VSEFLSPLYLVTDADRLGEERVLASICSAFEGGLRMIQLREPSWSVDRLESFGRDLLDRLPELNLVVNCRAGVDFRSRLSLAGRLGAPGIHIGGGETGLVEEAREITGGDLLVGYSAHSAAEASEAFGCGADYVSLSPVFTPLSKEGDFQPLGIDELARACSLLPGPVYALGGVTEELSASIRAAGAAGVGVITALQQAEDPASVARAFYAPWAGSAAGTG